MSNRRNRASANDPSANGRILIRGPQSALSSFLASAGIDANQIRRDAAARQAAASQQVATQAPQQAADAPDNDDDDDFDSDADANDNKDDNDNDRYNDDDGVPNSDDEVPESGRRLRSKKILARKEEKAIAKIKASKSFQTQRQARANVGMATQLGQMGNCEVCDKRFTVTGFTKAGPNGGVLCPNCTRDLDRREEGPDRKRRKTAAGQTRRQIQSSLLDGIIPGAKTLMTLCNETVAKNVQKATSLGDLTPKLVDDIAAVLSKRRLLDSTTLDLFLRPDTDTVTVYDGSSLTSDDYIRIFQVVPHLKFLRLRNAIQFKNKVMDHLLGTTVELESLSLHGANLIDDERWNRFMTEKSQHLKALKVYHTDGHFGDEQLEILSQACPQLECLKVVHNQKVSDDGIFHIANLTKLKRLTLEIYKATSTEPYVAIINSIGPHLKTLALATVNSVDDSVLYAIHENCQNLYKLRVTDNQVLTDVGFAELFTNWLNPSLTYIDLHKCRDIDASDPSNPYGIGFASGGFEAMMAHSGITLRYIDIHSCRHISREAFQNVFAEGKVYPALRELNLSFCPGVNDFVCGLIFKSCPNLKTLKVFGNFGVRDVKVPRGRILIGAPNALGMQIEGTEVGANEGRVI